MALIPAVRKQKKGGGGGVTLGGFLKDAAPFVALAAATYATGGAAMAGAGAAGATGAAGTTAAGLSTGAKLQAGASALGAASSFIPRDTPGQPKDPALPQMQNAMQRRTDYAGQDPMQSISEARQALSGLGLDPKTRELLEAPLIRAQQSGRA